MQDSSWRVNDVGEESSGHQGGLKESGRVREAVKDTAGFLVQVTERERVRNSGHWKVQ